MVSFSVQRYAPERSAWGKLTARDSVVRKLDWPLLGSAIALSFIGSLLVYSATRGRDSLTHGDPYYFLFRHALNTGIGFALMVGTIWLGHRTLRGAVPILYGLSVLLVLAVLTPLGATVNGAHAWIIIGGGFSLQPSEFTKITIILVMAMLLAERVDAGDQLHPDHRTVAKALGLAAVPMAVVMGMPDLGSVMVMVVIVLGVLLASGASNRWIAGLLGAGVVGAIAIWQLGLLDEYQIARFAAFANPALDPAGVGYNTNQARIAIGSGGLSGTGLFHGTQTTGQFVPEQQTDFVFTVAGEELGFLGGRPDPRTARSRPVARLPDRPRDERAVRHDRRRRNHRLVRLPGLREHRDDARHHAGRRAPAAVRVVRRILDVRRLGGRRTAPVDQGATADKRLSRYRSTAHSRTSRLDSGHGGLEARDRAEVRGHRGHPAPGPEPGGRGLRRRPPGRQRTGRRLLRHRGPPARGGLPHPAPPYRR